jgi:hypothetical protein
MAEDIVLNLLNILRRDAKDTTYKFALLRGMIEISSEHSHLQQTVKDYVSFPMGLLAEKWVQYYWPFIDEDIPQKHGKARGLALAFRDQHKTLTEMYRHKGGYAQFQHDYASHKLDPQTSRKYLALLKTLRQTIAGMPMKHLGQSVHGGLYHIVRKPGLPRIPKMPAEGITPGWVVQNLGRYELRRDYHEAFRKVGTCS